MMLQQPQPQLQPVAGPSRRRQRRRNPRPQQPHVPLIVLSDSDDDEPQPQRKRKKTGVIAKDDNIADLNQNLALNSVNGGTPVAGPSRLVAEAQPPAQVNDDSPLFDLAAIDPNIFVDAPPPPVAANKEKTADLEVQPPEQRIDDFLSQVLEIVPDVDPDHAVALVTQYIETFGAGVVEVVVGNLLEDSYPKLVRGKGKRKRDDIDEPAARSAPEFDYGNKDRQRPAGPHYHPLAEVCIHISQCSK